MAGVYRMNNVTIVITCYINYAIPNYTNTFTIVLQNKICYIIDLFT